MQRGLTLIELIICLGIIGIIACMSAPAVSQSLEKQELESTSLQLAADIRWLQQLSINAGSGTVSYIMLFKHSQPYGYDITANTQVVKHYSFPDSVKLPGFYSTIGFSLSGAPLIGAQTISLQSNTLKTWKYVILTPVTGRVRTSDTPPLRPEE